MPTVLPRRMGEVLTENARTPSHSTPRPAAPITFDPSRRKAYVMRALVAHEIAAADLPESQCIKNSNNVNNQQDDIVVVSGIQEGCCMVWRLSLI